MRCTVHTLYIKITFTVKAIDLYGCYHYFIENTQLYFVIETKLLIR